MKRCLFREFVKNTSLFDLNGVCESKRTSVACNPLDHSVKGSWSVLFCIPYIEIHCSFVLRFNISCICEEYVFA